MEASNVLRMVAQQEKFQEEREHIHVGIITETQDVVKFWGIVKVIIVVGLVGLQLFFLKRSLKTKHNHSFI